MVWGCFAGNKLGPLLAFEKGGISSAEYIQTLKDGLLKFLEDANAVTNNENSNTIQVATMGVYTFQQDNAPIHNSKATQAFFRQYNLSVMKWPANSPDLNPIEHLWPALKSGFHKEWEALGAKRPSRSEGAIATYIELLKQVWKEKLSDIPRRVVDSMPRRVAAVIAAKGGHTKY
jgi:hypothetical protein